MPLLKKKLEEVNNPLTTIVQKQSTKKKPNWSGGKFSSFFVVKDIFKNNDVKQKLFFYQLRPFDCQKSLIDEICENYLD
jgi:hypothetical protein